MDALRFWGEWMAERSPPSASARASYDAALTVVEAGGVAGIEELYVGCLTELEGTDPHLAAPANHNLAVALQQRGDLDGALFHCVRALFLYHRVGDLPGTWAGLRNLAVVFRARGDNARAMDSQRKGAARGRARARPDGRVGVVSGPGGRSGRSGRAAAAAGRERGAPAPGRGGLSPRRLHLEDPDSSAGLAGRLFALATTLLLLDPLGRRTLDVKRLGFPLALTSFLLDAFDDPGLHGRLLRSASKDTHRTFGRSLLFDS